MLGEVLTDQKTQDKLGEEGIAAVRASLWPKDCQSCGRGLGAQAPALCVNDLVTWATATLHHRRCRAPGWNDGSAIQIAGGANTSWTSMSFMLPAMHGRRPDPRPVMLINPGLEMIFLYPDQGTWRPGYSRQFTSLGMLPPGRQLLMDRPLPGLSAWLADDLISVTVQTPPETIYEANAPREVVDRARELRGVMFMVTHELDPAALYAAPAQALQRLQQMLQSGRVICGLAATTPG